MKSRKVGIFAAIGLCILSGVFVRVSASRSQTAPSQQLGKVSNGLRMSISLSRSGQGDSLPAFQVELHNMGEKDMTLDVGTMLANGKVQFPENIRFHLRDETGKIRELHFSAKRYAAIAGRVDDYVVPLRVGSTYSVLLKLEQFWSPASKEFVLKLKPGRYEVTAQFQGSGAKTHNIGNEGIALMNFWKGKVQSNALSFIE